MQGSGPGVSACLWALQAFKNEQRTSQLLDVCSQNLVFDGETDIKQGPTTLIAVVTAGAMDCRPPGSSV